ncbi:MAG TPA: glycerate kinase [Bryobacteraceae bacterium]|nr:glycerate kinase [Bryobacteraceae bacterium]
MSKATHQHALAIFRAALDAADPEQAVAHHLHFDGRTLRAGSHRYALSAFDRVQVIGAGKASARMARAVERILGARLAGGLINVPDGTGAKLRRVRLNSCGHPVPDQRGMDGAQRILEIARQAGPRDLLICVISGGASALLPLPAPPMTLAQKQDVTRALLVAGANIHELNAVRKHLSLIKGGQLACAAHPAAMLTLILSDVIGDDLDVIGSGPTVPDRTTSEEALTVVKKYAVPVAPEWLHETPKPGDAAFARVQNLIVGSNRLAIDGAARKARELGYHTLVLSSSIEGETREIGLMHAAIAKEIVERNRPVRRPACVLSGGETTVTVRGRGLGGRNQEFVLAAALALEGVDGVTVFSAGTDGIDGPTPAAGAIADGNIVQQARSRGVDARAYLDDNDSYRFFERMKGLVRTGPTGTNVMDIRLLLVTSDSVLRRRR